MEQGMIKVISTKFKASKKRPYFPIANEDLTKLKKDLLKFSDIDYYFGVCGGGTQNIFLLAMLTKKNRLKKIELLDIQTEPLINFTYVAKAYNTSKDDLHYLTRLVKAYRRFKIKPETIPYRRFFSQMFFHKSSGFEETNFKKHLLNRKIIVKLKHRDILKYIEKGKIKPGKYFIYLSNILTFGGMPYQLKNKYRWHYLKNLKEFGRKDYLQYVRMEYIKSVLTPLILKNKAILNGSLILVVIAFRFGAKNNQIVLFEKEHKELATVKSYKLPSD